MLGGGWCSLVSKSCRRKSVILPLLGGTTSVASQKRPCCTALFAKTWLPSSSLVEAQERYPSGELPSFTRAEFERYLRCGLLCHGFARVRCPTCHDELLVAFSCKNRGLCPSCASRRMADFAAHLRDRVLPAVAVRQWVLTLPLQLRFLIAWRPKLIGLTLTLFPRALFAWQRRCARRPGIAQPLCGAVTCIQRFGSALNINLHFPTLTPDGVFSENSDGNVQFHSLPPPSVPDLERIARRFIPRLLKSLAAASEQNEAADWMHLLTQYLQAQPPRAAQTMDRPHRWLKELFDDLYTYHSEAWARRFFDRWFIRATHSHLEPICRVAWMVKRHFANIVTGISFCTTLSGSCHREALL